VIRTGSAAPELIVLGFVLAIMLIAILQPYTFIHYYTLRHGAAREATIERVIRVRRGLGRSRVMQKLFVLQYSPQPRQEATASVSADGLPSAEVGDKVAIHYLPQRPDWVAVDNDQTWIYMRWGLAPFLLFFLPAGAIIYIRARRQRSLVRLGTPVGALVEQVRVAPGTANQAMITLSFEWDGRLRRTEERVPQSAGLQPGQVVTALVDPQRSHHALLYASSPYRALSNR